MNSNKSRIAWEFHIDTSFMDAMEPVAALTQRYRVKLLKKAKRERVKAGTKLHGEDEQRWLTYILKGRVEYAKPQAGDSDNVAGTHQQALFYPSYKGEAKVMEDALLLRFDHNLYQAMLKNKEMEQVAVDDVDMSDIEAAVFSGLMLEGSGDGLTIPSIPDVAMRISKATSKDDADINKISKIMLNDPVLCARVIQYANSGQYAGLAASKTLSEAMMRLGLKAVKHIAMSYAVSEVFKQPSKLLTNKVQELYQHSMKIAVLSYFFAKRYTKLEPEYALLVGLVHEIGLIPIFNYIVSHGEKDIDEDLLNSISEKIVRMISTLALHKWGFDDELVQIIDEGVNYEQYGNENADYSDLLNVAHWCNARLVNNSVEGLPELDQIPAFRKLGIEYLTDEEFEDIVNQSEKTTNSIHYLLE